MTPFPAAVGMLIGCMDKRLAAAFYGYLKEKGMLGHCYASLRAGAVKGLIDPTNPSFADSIWSDIAIGVGKGGVSKIILCNHTDCAAYGGSGAFSGFEAEKEFQIKEMAKARDLILKKYPDLEVSLVLAAIKKEEIGFEEIG